MSKISFDYKTASAFLTDDEVMMQREYVAAAHDLLHNKKGPGSDFLGWLDLPAAYDKEEFARIKKSAAKIRENSDVLVVIGIGGSYLGARAAIEFCRTLQNFNSKPQILYAGNSISSTYLSSLIDYVKDKDFSINVISNQVQPRSLPLHSGCFVHWLRKNTEKDGARERIYVTTDKSRGALKIGGRRGL